MHVLDPSLPGEGLQTFDMESLLERLMGDCDLAQMIVAAFVDDCPKQLRIIRNCIDTADGLGLRIQAHSLKGASATISAQHLSHTAFAMEEAAQKMDFGQCNLLFARVEEEVIKFTTALTTVSWLSVNHSPGDRMSL